MKLRLCQVFIGSVLVMVTAVSLQAQVIEPSLGESLTITEDINLDAGKTLRQADTVLLKTSNSLIGNLFLGLRAGTANTSAEQNTFVGASAGQNSNGRANTFVGYSAGKANTSGQFNTFMGVQAGLQNTTGSSNFIMGTNAGVNNTTGSANFFLGDNAGGANTTGGYNVYLGTNAGSGSGVNGSNNVGIGFESGRANSGGNVNTFLGFRADAGATNLENATAIGANAKVNSSNAIVLGNGANVGIGNSAPSTRLHITTGVANTSGLRLENLTSGTTAGANASKFLTVDGAGNVVLANIAGNARLGAETDLLWQRKGGYLQSTKSEAVIIGQRVSKTPAGYRLYVEDGILTEKVKVAVRNTSEWSDYVFRPDYALRPLREVAQYVATYRHLPGIPSAQDMVKNGNNLHQTDARLLAKIEELTLYSIQLEETNRQQQQELQQIKQKQAELEKVVQQLLKK